MTYGHCNLLLDFAMKIILAYLPVSQKQQCLLLYKALEGLAADGSEGLRDSVPVPAEGVMLAGGERGEARPDVIFTTLCQSGESPPCKTHVPKIPPTADQACTHPLKLIQHH